LSSRGNAFLHVRLCFIAEEHSEKTYGLKRAPPDNARQVLLHPMQFFSIIM